VGHLTFEWILLRESHRVSILVRFNHDNIVLEGRVT
jgi:hypothetical protein